MNATITAAPMPGFSPTPHLPNGMQAECWPSLIERAAAALQACCASNSETLVPELRGIASALRAWSGLASAANGVGNACIVGSHNAIHIHVHIAPCAEVTA